MTLVPSLVPSTSTSVSPGLAAINVSKPLNQQTGKYEVTSIVLAWIISMFVEVTQITGIGSRFDIEKVGGHVCQICHNIGT